MNHLKKELNYVSTVKIINKVVKNVKINNIEYVK